VALDFLFDLVFEPLLNFAILLLDLLVKLVKSVWRVVDVRRTAPEAHHTLTEYADAFLFPDEEDKNRSNSSRPSSILDARRR
jgi:hypothetical protein